MHRTTGNRAARPARLPVAAAVVVLLAAAALVAGLAGSGARAAEPAAEGSEGPTRVEYVKGLEGVCRPDAEATRRAMKGARADIGAERLAVAAGKFAKATRIFGGTVKKIATFARPPADTARLAKWFRYLNAQESYLKLITTQLRKDNPIRAQRLTARFIHNGNLANNTVLAFGFDYCSFKFSRYG